MTEYHEHKSGSNTAIVGLVALFIVIAVAFFLYQTGVFESGRTSRMDVNVDVPDVRLDADVNPNPNRD